MDNLEIYFNNIFFVDVDKESNEIVSCGAELELSVVEFDEEGDLNELSSDEYIKAIFNYKKNEFENNELSKEVSTYENELNDYLNKELMPKMTGIYNFLVNFNLDDQLNGQQLEIEDLETSSGEHFSAIRKDNKFSLECFGVNENSILVDFFYMDSKTENFEITIDPYFQLDSSKLGKNKIKFLLKCM